MYKMWKKDFVYKIYLTKHIRENHKSYKPCRNIETCVYKNRCRWNHKVYPEGNQVCFECGNDYKTMHELMRHRKASHKVPMCKDNMRNDCGYSSEDCYYTHSVQTLLKRSPARKAHEPNQTKPQAQGFWDPPSNLAPPSQGPGVDQGPTQSEWIQMKNMLIHLNQLMTKFY